MNEESTNLVERVRFGTFELNVRSGELVSIGTEPVEPESAKVLLREQPFRILRILVERQGQIVSRQEIRQILWPNDTFVDYDRSINVAMAILRKSLADDAYLGPCTAPVGEVSDQANWNFVLDSLTGRFPNCTKEQHPSFTLTALFFL